MYSQSFSSRNLYFCTTPVERRNDIINKDNIAQKVDPYIGELINDGTFKFRIKVLNNLYLNGNQKGSMEYFCQDLVLRKLYKNIKRIYGVEQANRNLIIKQISSLLREESQKWVVRLDVRHFFESINRNRLMKRFQEDGRLNYQSIELLKNLFYEIPQKGLPRGLSTSSVMSELYLKRFDLEIRRMNGIYYYARFVDDIIIFCSNKKVQENVWARIPKLLSNIDLELNFTKSYKWDNASGGKLTYLGYTFNQRGKTDVDVVIAEKKISIIKTRITKSFVRFAKDGDFYKLKNRIKFLTGNYKLYNSSSLLPIKAGIYFNYSMAKDEKSMLNLDEYYQKILHCKTGRLGSRLASQMSINQRQELTKYSFVFGFEHHVNHFFTSAMLADITECWQ